MKYAAAYYQNGVGIFLEIVEADCKFSAIKKVLDYNGNAKSMEDLETELEDYGVEFKVVPVFITVKSTVETGGEHRGCEL